YVYFFRLGFLDGYPGFVYAMFKFVQTFHVKAKIGELKRSQPIKPTVETCGRFRVEPGGSETCAPACSESPGGAWGAAHCHAWRPGSSGCWALSPRRRATRPRNRRESPIF